MSRADSPGLSFPAAPATSLHRAKAWDQGALSARPGDASKRLQSLSDKLLDLQTSESLERDASAFEIGTTPEVLHTGSNMAHRLGHDLEQSGESGRTLADNLLHTVPVP